MDEEKMIPAELETAVEGAQQEAAQIEPPKKRRGRPPKNPDILTEKVDGAEASGQSAARPRKTAKGKATDVGALAQQLVGVHQLVAMVAGIPEAQIAPQEGEHLAKAIVAVCDEYGLSVTGKTGAALQLFAAAAMIYGPRVWAFNVRVKTERENAAAAQARETPGEIIPLHVSPTHSGAVGG